MTTSSRPPVARETHKSELHGTLGVAAILFMVLAAAAPLGVVAGAVPVGVLLGNGAGLPGLFVIAAAVLLLFAVGFSAMATKIPRPGAFFSFIGVGLGRPAGVGAAWLAMLTYTSIQLALYAYMGAILSATVQALGGPTLHWALYSVLVLLVIAILGYRNVSLSARVLSILLVLEVVIVLVVVGAIVVQGGVEGLSLEPFRPDVVLSGAPGVGLIFVVGAFIGFEATAIFRSEARDPQRTIPRATYLAVVGVGVFYGLASWGLIMGWGPSQLFDVIAANLDNIFVVTTEQYVGIAWAIVANVLLITSFFASILAFHNIISRYQHSMANAGLLPSKLANVHGRHASPHLSSLVQTATALVLIAVFALTGLEPILQAYSWFAGVATLSVVLLMAATSIAVISFFARHKRDRRPWNTVIAPALGGLGLFVFIVALVANFPVLVANSDPEGNPIFGAVSLSLFALIVVFAVLGVVQALILRKRNPQAYANVIQMIAETPE